MDSKETQLLNLYWETISNRTGTKLSPPYMWRVDYLRGFGLELGRDKELLEMLKQSAPLNFPAVTPQQNVETYSGGLCIMLSLPQFDKDVWLHPGIVRPSRDTPYIDEDGLRTSTYLAGLVESHSFYALRDIVLTYQRHNPDAKVQSLYPWGMFVSVLIGQMIGEEEGKYLQQRSVENHVNFSKETS